MFSPIGFQKKIIQNHKKTTNDLQLVDLLVLHSDITKNLNLAKSHDFFYFWHSTMQINKKYFFILEKILKSHMSDLALPGPGTNSATSDSKFKK